MTKRPARRTQPSASRRSGTYGVAALAAGGAIQAAEIGTTEPGFGLIRPPGHDPSANSYWSFCYFNNMAIALEKLRNDGRIRKALVLDIDLHFGDGTVDILGDKACATIVSPSSNSSTDFVCQVDSALTTDVCDLIGISAGFDHAREDWGHLLGESDYTHIGRMDPRALGPRLHREEPRRRDRRGRQEGGGGALMKAVEISSLCAGVGRRH